MPMTIDFSGKNVLVVGGGRGIGKEIALTFAECGANVVIGDYNAENGEAAAQEIGALGVTGLFYPCNVAKREDVDALVAHAAELDGGLDVIVNTAGVTSSQDTINISDEEFHRIININLLGAANAPGYVRTQIWDPILDGISSGFSGKRAEDNTDAKRDQDYANEIKNEVPLGRTQTSRDIAWATVFLASDYAQNITGQTLAVDGGSTMV